MSKQLLKRLEKYIEATSEEKMKRVDEIGQKYAAHKLNGNALEACLLQVPIVEIWLSLILEHKLLLVHFANQTSNQYFDFEYKNNGNTTLSHLITAYKIFFPELHSDLVLFKKRRNNMSHFIYDNHLPVMKDVELGDHLIVSLRKVNQKLFDEVKVKFNL